MFWPKDSSLSFKASSTISATPQPEQMLPIEIPSWNSDRCDKARRLRKEPRSRSESRWALKAQFTQESTSCILQIQSNLISLRTVYEHPCKQHLSPWLQLHAPTEGLCPWVGSGQKASDLNHDHHQRHQTRKNPVCSGPHLQHLTWVSANQNWEAHLKNVHCKVRPWGLGSFSLSGKKSGSAFSSFSSFCGSGAGVLQNREMTHWLRANLPVSKRSANTELWRNRSSLQPAEHVNGEGEGGSQIFNYLKPLTKFRFFQLAGKLSSRRAGSQGPAAHSIEHWKMHTVKAIKGPYHLEPWQG